MVIPSYKEKNLKELEDRVDVALRYDIRVKKHEIIIVKDNIGKGYGYSLKRGIKKAKHDWILILDADFTYSPADIPRLICDVPYSDMVVAERRGTLAASGLLRTIGRLIVKRYACWKCGYNIRDYNSGFRIFHKELYENAKKYLPEKFSFTTTITLYAIYRNYRINYIPVFYSARTGKSCLKPMEFFNFIRTINKCVKTMKR